MVDSLNVLFTLKVAYGIYSVIIIALFAWFAYSLIAKHKHNEKNKLKIL